MIILRKGTKTNFSYEDIDGDKIKDKKILEYIEGLRIPPAYKDVEIFYIKNPKILFQGTDDAGRLQQIYSQAHCRAACKKKFKSLIEFGASLPRIYADCDKFMRAARATRNKVVSIIIKIISMCYFRVGHTKYVKLYNHYGISTIKKSHIKKVSNGLQIEFIGKKGVVNECVISDPVIASAIQSLISAKKPGDHVFTYEEDGAQNLISATEINDWLRQYGKEFSTKMFRNFDANIMLIDFLRKEHATQDVQPEQLPLPKRKKIIAAAMKSVSSEINNTPAICKKAYVSQDLLELYLNHPRKFKSKFLNSKSARLLFISFLGEL